MSSSLLSTRFWNPLINIPSVNSSFTHRIISGFIACDMHKLSESIKSNSKVVVAPEYSISMKYFPDGKISFWNGYADGIVFDNFSIGIGIALLF